ncbi:MAG: PAS domain S-box protein [Gammaproteobacteria bacterium]|nr:PAS domain S-box protein [Gammaproteobacteria bacterium]
MKYIPSHMTMVIIILAMLLLILFIDHLTPIGIADTFLYVTPILISLWLPWRGFIYLVAAISSLFTIIGYYLSPEGADTSIALIHRGESLFIIWLTAILCALLIQKRLLNQAIINTAVDGIITINSGGIIQTFNHAAQDIFGYSAEEVIGHNVSTLMPSPYHEEHDQYIKNYLDTGQKKIIGIGREVTGLRKDGSTFPLDLSVGEYYFGEEQHFVGILRDITARKKIQENITIRTNQLAALTSLSEQLLSNLPFEELMNKIAYAIANTLGMEYVKILELLPDQKNLLFHVGIGWPHTMIKGKTIPVESDSMLAYTLQTDQPVVVYNLKTDPRFKDTPLLSSNGIVSCVSISIGERNRPFGILCACKDREYVFDDNEISFIKSVANLLGIAINRKQTEIRIRDLQQKMLSMSRINTIGELGTALAHELNQPVTALMNYVNACRRIFDTSKVNISNNVVELMDKIVAQANRVSLIINHLRDYVNTGVLHRYPENLNTVIQDAGRLIMAEAIDKNIRVKYDLQSDLPPVFIDKIQIQQVVFNLLHNSMRALEQSIKRELTIKTAQSPGQAIEVLIQDTGPGIDPGIFDLDFKNIFSTDEHGMGIGLSICKSIIEGHEGLLWTSVTPGGGATVHFTIPIVKAGNNIHA